MPINAEIIEIIDKYFLIFSILLHPFYSNYYILYYIIYLIKKAINYDYFFNWICKLFIFSFSSASFLRSSSTIFAGALLT